MGWYYFSGIVVEPVPVGKGEVVAVRPNTKVFIDPTVEASAEVQRLRGRHLLTPCAWPKGEKSLVPKAPVASDVEVPKTPYADALTDNLGAVEVEKPARKKAPAKRKAAPKKKPARAKKAAAEDTASTESDPQGSED